MTNEPIHNPKSRNAMQRLGRALGMSPTRSRVLMILPFLIALLTLGIGYAVMVRYNVAIEDGVLSDPLELAAFQRTTGLLVLGLGIAAFIVGLLIVYAIRSALRGVAEDLQQAAAGHLSAPTTEVSEREISELHGQIRHMVEAFNRMSRDSGMGATILVDGVGRIEMLNPMAQLLLGVSPDEAIGRPVESVLAADDEANAQVVGIIQRSLKSRQPVEPCHVQLIAADGRHIAARLRTSFFTSEQRPQMAIMLVDYDLSQLMDIRDKIERAARFLTLGSLSAHLAHEIRNPLTSIGGLIDLLKDHQPDEKTKQQYIEHIEASAGRLNHLIENLMDFAAIERCELKPQLLEPVLRQVVAAKQADPRWSDRSVVFRCDPSVGKVHCNEMWVSRAVINLIDNACEATPAGGEVTVNLIPGPDPRDGYDQALGCPSVDVVVHNPGSYIRPEDRKKVFEPFFTGRPTGTGLGLSVVQEIVRAHGGLVLVESDEQEGTCFIIRLPAQGAARMVAQTQ